MATRTTTSNQTSSRSTSGRRVGIARSVRALMLIPTRGVLVGRPGLISLVAGVVLVALGTVSSASGITGGTGPFAGLTPDQQAHQIIGSAFLMGLFAAAACAISVVRDIGSGLYGALALRYPGRRKILAFSSASAVMVGLVAGAVGIIAAAAAGLVSNAVFGLDIPVLAAILPSAAPLLLAVAVQAVIGSLLAWVIQRSAPTVLLLIGWIVIAEPALMGLAPRTSPFLLSGGGAGLVNDLSIVDRPSALAGLLVQVLWIAAIATAAIVLVDRRDVPANSAEDRS